MNNQNILTPRQLVISGLTCLILAIVVVVMFILPAEYGEDTAGFGKITGLNKLAKTDSLPSDASVETSTETTLETTAGTESHYQFIDPRTTAVSYDWWGEPEPALSGNNHKEHASVFKNETIQITLDVDGITEYKAIMNEGDSLAYSWIADQNLYADFHAHQDTGNPDFFTRYSETEGKHGHGSIVAPYAGQHGWFWLNQGDHEATIELSISGFYEELIEIDLTSEAE